MTLKIFFFFTYKIERIIFILLLLQGSFGLNEVTQKSPLKNIKNYMNVRHIIVISIQNHKESHKVLMLYIFCKALSCSLHLINESSHTRIVPQLRQTGRNSS